MKSGHRRTTTVGRFVCLGRACERKYQVRLSSDRVFKALQSSDIAPFVLSKHYSTSIFAIQAHRSRVKVTLIYKSRDKNIWDYYICNKTRYLYHVIPAAHNTLTDCLAPEPRSYFCLNLQRSLCA